MDTACHPALPGPLCFTLLDREYPGTVAAQLPLEAFDFLGRRMP